MSTLNCLARGENMPLPLNVKWSIPNISYNSCYLYLQNITGK
jgi:hypothetical protein